MYLVKTPWWLRKIYPKLTWRLPVSGRQVFLTFDDGPHPAITPWVLDQLQQWNCTATFFCIGKNVAAYPNIYQRILHEGHRAGNHTNDHLNGWHTPNEQYIANIATAAQHISSNLFRPPYGRIRHSQAGRLLRDYEIIMWDVLSADFDTSISGEQCLNNVIRHVQPGAIIVFHDSEKAFSRLEYALPKTLQFLSNNNYLPVPIP